MQSTQRGSVKRNCPSLLISGEERGKAGVLTACDFVPLGEHTAMSGGSFGCHTLGDVLLASKDTAEHPTRHESPA